MRGCPPVAHRWSITSVSSRTGTSQAHRVLAYWRIAGGALRRFPKSRNRGASRRRYVGQRPMAVGDPPPGKSASACVPPLLAHPGRAAAAAIDSMNSKISRRASHLWIPVGAVGECDGHTLSGIKGKVAIIGMARRMPSVAPRMNRNGAIRSAEIHDALIVSYAGPDDR